ncbi:MAG: DUF3137 domain-containing protein [Aureispira sp.]|nr:DUF3137 domain-containing protein [Aureispira sp.]
MKSLSELRQQIAPTLRRVEKFRLEKLELAKQGWKYQIVPVLIALLGGYFLLQGEDGLVFGIITMVVAVGTFICIYIFAINKHLNQFEEHFKEEVFTQLVHEFYPSIKFSPKRHIDSNDFNSSQLFGSHNRYSGEDFFDGTIEHTPVRFSELAVKKVTTNGSGNNRKTTTTTIFDGLFFVVQMQKRTYGKVAVLPDSAESMFGSVGKFFQKTFGKLFQGGQLVHFEEHPEFEKEFVVYSKEEEEAHRILTPTMLNAIYDLRYKWGSNVRLSFIDHNVYIAISSSKNLFEVDSKQSILENSLLQELYDELILCFSIIEDLNLQDQ